MTDIGKLRCEIESICDEGICTRTDAFLREYDACLYPVHVELPGRLRVVFIGKKVLDEDVGLFIDHGTSMQKAVDALPMEQLKIIRGARLIQIAIEDQISALSDLAELKRAIDESCEFTGLV